MISRLCQLTEMPLNNDASFVLFTLRPARGDNTVGRPRSELSPNEQQQDWIRQIANDSSSQIESHGKSLPDDGDNLVVEFSFARTVKRAEPDGRHGSIDPCRLLLQLRDPIILPDPNILERNLDLKFLLFP